MIDNSDEVGLLIKTMHLGMLRIMFQDMTSAYHTCIEVREGSPEGSASWNHCTARAEAYTRLLHDIAAEIAEREKPAQENDP